MQRRTTPADTALELAMGFLNEATGASIGQFILVVTALTASDLEKRLDLDLSELDATLAMGLFASLADHIATSSNVMTGNALTPPQEETLKRQRADAFVEHLRSILDQAIASEPADRETMQ